MYGIHHLPASPPLLPRSVLSLAAASLVLVACQASDSAPSDGAEALAYLHLDERADTLLAGVDEVWTDRVQVDALGTTHTRLLQTVGGVPVFGAAAIVHTDAQGAFDGMTDGLVRDLAIDPTPTLGERDAVARALEVVGARNDASAESRGELLALRHDGRDHLAYRVQLRQLERGQVPSAPVVFIDAHTGEEIWRYEGLQHAALSSTGYVTHDALHGTKLAGAPIGDSSDAVLFETHTSVRTTLKFMSRELGRSSYDGAGTVVHAYGHYDTGYVNAFWDDGAARLVLGDGDGVNFGHFGVLDIVAHELGHAVADHEANFTYFGEPGALDESNGDIMAATVENFKNGGWVFDIGEDCWLPNDPSQALRYMSRPSDDGVSRDHYSERYEGPADNGGVHFNSGIANHFFYLLSEGGRHHTPALRSGVTVGGLGIEAAYQIWYRALTTYMLPSSDFEEAREATADAADDLFGAAARLDVEKAWYEVGVGGPP